MIASVRSSQAARAGAAASTSQHRLVSPATHLMALAYLAGGDWGILPAARTGGHSGGSTHEPHETQHFHLRRAVRSRTRSGAGSDSGPGCDYGTGRERP